LTRPWDASLIFDVSEQKLFSRLSEQTRMQWHNDILILKSKLAFNFIDSTYYKRNLKHLLRFSSMIATRKEFRAHGTIKLKKYSSNLDSCSY